MNVKKIIIAGIVFVIVITGTYFVVHRYNNGDVLQVISENNESRNEYSDLLKINKDVIGMINIKGTKVNYPVVKAKDNEFYLDYNIKKEESKEGAIFMDYRNVGNGKDKNTIIYGHNMKNGSMFQNITKYKDEDFLKKNPNIEFNTLNEDIKWKVFSVYETDTEFNYLRTKFQDNNDYKKFLTDIKNRSIYYLKVEVSDDDEILTLSTCSYEFEDARFVVHAKKIK